jgi:hypothetical protein
MNLEFTFEECQIPGDGSLKSRNWPPDEIQREKLTQRGVDTPFRINVSLITCVHGTMSKEDPTPASLLIFEYHLFCTKSNHMFDTVETSFKFDYEPVQRPGKGHPSQASPNVVAFAPFRVTERFDASSSEVRKSFAAGISAGLNFPLPVGPTVSATVSIGKEETHEQRYFGEGYGDRDWDERSKRNYGVWWCLRHNESQAHGIPSMFRTAILLKRKTDAPFSCKFLCVVSGGLLFEIKQKILGLVDPDDPINFDPAAPPQGEWNGLDLSSLGDLADGKKLDGLAYVWGLQPLQPVADGD